MRRGWSKEKVVLVKRNIPDPTTQPIFRGLIKFMLLIDQSRFDMVFPLFLNPAIISLN